MINRRNGWTCALLLAGTACSPDARDTSATQEWAIRERIRIGVVSGNPAQEFGRVTGAVKMRDGRIVVADHQALELKVFAADGELLQILGGRGQGPGEFVGLTRLVRLQADTLLAGNNLNMVTFSPRGMFVREQLMDWTGAVSRPQFVETQYPTSSGGFILYVMSSSGEREEGELYRSPTLYLLADTEHGVRDTLGFFRGLEQMTFTDAEGSHTAVPLFPSSTILMIGTNYAVIGDQASDSVLRYDLIRGETKWIPLPLKGLPVPEAVHREAFASACDWTSDQEGRRRCELNNRRLPEQRHFPTFEDLAVDSIGTIWVKQYPHTPRSTTATWLVVDASGRSIATVQIPSNVRPMQIGRDYFLGIMRDDLGVQSVGEYEVTK